MSRATTSTAGHGLSCRRCRAHGTAWRSALSTMCCTRSAGRPRPGTSARPGSPSSSISPVGTRRRWRQTSNGVRSRTPRPSSSTPPGPRSADGCGCSAACAPTTSPPPRSSPTTGRSTPGRRDRGCRRPVDHATAVNYRGEAVVIGGFLESRQASDHVYALRGDKWVKLPPLNRARAAAAAAVVGNRIVVVGGQAGGKLVPQTEIYDGQGWTQAAAMPTPREHLGAASDGRYLYAVGGRGLSATENTPAFERYDPERDRWTGLDPMPKLAGAVGAAFLDGRVIAVGGEGTQHGLGCGAGLRRTAAGLVAAVTSARTAPRVVGGGASRLALLDRRRRGGRPRRFDPGGLRPRPRIAGCRCGFRGRRAEHDDRVAEAQDVAVAQRARLGDPLPVHVGAVA